MKETFSELDVLRGEESLPLMTEASPRARNVARMRLLWEQRGQLWKSVWRGLLVSMVIAFLLPSSYESTTRLMPPDEQSSARMAVLSALTGKGDSDMGMLAGDVLGLKSSGALFIGVLNSRTVRNDLINKFDLRKVYWRRTYEAAGKILAANTAISEDRKSGIISITVTDRDPHRAADMAREYVDELNLVVSQLNTSAAHRERVFLEQRLTQVKRDLEDAERDFGKFASKTGAIDIKEQGKAMVGAAATLQGELIAAQSELEGLKQIYTEGNYRVRTLQARIAELRNELVKLGGKYDESGEESDDNPAEVYPPLRKLPILGVSYADLYRRTKVQETVFGILTQEFELAKVNEAKAIPSVKVLDSADVPEKHSFPPRLLLIALGTCLATAGMAGWILLSAQWGQIDPADPQKAFAQEVFHAVNSHMPWAMPNGSRFQAAAHSAWVRLGRRTRQPSEGEEPRP